MVTPGDIIRELAYYAPMKGKIISETEEYNKREELIGKFVQLLNTKNREAARVSPRITKKESGMSLTAQRIAWVLFQDQFPKNLRWAVHRDPFYADVGLHMMTDVVRTTIQACCAAAERRYRGFINKCRRKEDPLVMPIPEDHSSSSSHSSSSNPMTRRNLRTSREGVIIASAPRSEGGFRSRSSVS